MSVATPVRSARAPTCSRRPALVACSVSSYCPSAVVSSSNTCSDIPSFARSSFCAVAFSKIARTHREQRLVRGVRRRHAELLRQLRILCGRHCAHGTQIAEDSGLQRAPELLPCSASTGWPALFPPCLEGRFPGL